MQTQTTTKAMAKLSAAAAAVGPVESPHQDDITGTEKQPRCRHRLLSRRCRLMNETRCVQRHRRCSRAMDAVLVAVHNPQPRTTVTPRLVTVLLAPKAADAADVVAVLPMWWIARTPRWRSPWRMAHVDDVRFTKAELFPRLDPR